MKMQNDIVAIAYSIASKAHSGQFDKGGAPYIEHPVAVSNLCSSENEKAVALLHDVIEDTSVTSDELISRGIPQMVVDAVLAMTHVDGESYDDYLLRLSKNPIATRVKIADLTHNMDMARIPDPTENDYRRLLKYKKSKSYLEAII